MCVTVALCGFGPGTLKLGVFGGTFDPIHMGHLVVAEEARVQLGLDEVLFVPAGRPWFKSDVPVTDADHRLTMVELSVASNPAFRPSDIEITRPGPTYTTDTLESLREELGDTVQLYVILGADALSDLERWHEPQRILELAEIVGVTRPSHGRVDLGRLEASLGISGDSLKLLEGPLIEVSGTDIRRRIREGRSIKYLVPETVEAYILEQGLYR